MQVKGDGMSAIEFVSGTYRSRVDGTLVLSIEFEPRHRAAALELFGMPGTGGCAARLLNQAELAHRDVAERAAAPAPKGGSWSQWVAMRCTEPAFQAWLGVETEAEAAEMVREMSGCYSRAEIDNVPAVLALFKARVLEPWKRFKGVT